MSNIPDKPLDHYPDATDIPALPPSGTEGDPVKKPVEPVELEFLNTESRKKEFPLEHPFTWNEQEIRKITLRRLKGFEVGQVYGTKRDTKISLHSFYEIMTGLPEAVLKALDADDADRLASEAYPFLPRVFREWLTSDNGDDSSS